MNSDLEQRGDAAKREGMARAAEAPGREQLMLETQYALIRCLLESPRGHARTLDDATPIEGLQLRFPDAGKWRGAAVAELSRDGLIAVAGFVMSKRPSSHRSLIRRWKIVSGKVPALRMRLAFIEARLEQIGTWEDADCVYTA